MIGGVKLMNLKIKKVNAFISYSHKDMKYKNKILPSLEALKQSYNIESWHDGKIDAGNNIDDNVKKALNKSHLILLLVTDNFVSSHYCMNIELEAAQKRADKGQCIIIPVMFQETVLTDTLAFFRNNRVPEDGKPIATGFKNQSQGCTRAVKMIQNLIDNQFPNCKKYISPKKRSNKSDEDNEPIGIKLYKDGSLKQIPVTQKIMDLIPQCHSSMYKFSTLMEQSLINSQKNM